MRRSKKKVSKFALHKSKKNEKCLKRMVIIEEGNADFDLAIKFNDGSLAIFEGISIIDINTNMQNNVEYTGNCRSLIPISCGSVTTSFNIQGCCSKITYKSKKRIE